MSLAPFLAALAAMAQPGAAPAPALPLPLTPPPAGSSARWNWRVCTRNSADAQLRARSVSMEHESIVRRAFADCEALLAVVDRTQSAEDIEHLRKQQSQLIRNDVEIFYWDQMTGHI